jgi:hypothetical protein
MGFDHTSIFESDEQSGGLLMMRRNNVKIIVKSVTKNYIDVVVEDGMSWRFTGIYDEPSWGQQHVTWDALRTVHGQMKIPWLVLDDFNEIMFNYEKEGVCPRSQQAMREFHDVLKDRELKDIWGMLETFLRGGEEN